MSASEFEGHEALIAQLQAGTLDAPNHLHRRVLALRGEKRARVPMSRRRKLFLVVPVAAALAVGAAVVHSLVNSGSPKSAAQIRLNPRVPHRPRHVPPTGVVGANGPTGAAGATGANGASGARGAVGENGPAYGPASLSALGKPMTAHGTADSRKALYSFDAASQASGSVLINTHRLTHVDANLQVAVPSHDGLTRATNKATEIVTKLGGYSQNVQYQATRSGYGRAQLTLRVPLAKTQTAIAQLGGLGRLVYQQVSTQDLQQQVTKQTNAIGSLQRAIQVYEQALQSGTLTGSQRVDVQVKLENAQHQLASTRKSRAGAVKLGRTANIYLNLTTNPHSGAARHHKTGRVGQMLHNMGDFLGLEGVIVLYILVVAFPIVLIGALAWWIMRERRRREERLLAANA